MRRKPRPPLHRRSVLRTAGVPRRHTHSQVPGRCRHRNALPASAPACSRIPCFPCRRMLRFRASMGAGPSGMCVLNSLSDYDSVWCCSVSATTIRNLISGVKYLERCTSFLIAAFQVMEIAHICFYVPYLGNLVHTWLEFFFQKSAFFQSRAPEPRSPALRDLTPRSLEGVDPQSSARDFADVNAGFLRRQRVFSHPVPLPCACHGGLL